ncbi:MAG TPA: DUF885 domain-containing protein, partial [Bacteroidia bacterium]|nr:DUF885 domain-containing protein [Bacteroidia bacterium]
MKRKEICKQLCVGLVLILSLTLVFSCQTNKSDSVDQDFERYKDTFIESIWKLNPSWAMYVGYHKYDSVLLVPDSNYLVSQVATYESLLNELKKIDEGSLNQNNKVDYWMMRDFVLSSLWYAKEFKSHEWNPAVYNVGGEFAEILNGRFATLDERMRSVFLRMQNVPHYYQVAESNISNPTKEHTELAILQNKGALSIFGTSLIDSLNVCKNLSDREKEEFKSRINLTTASIEKYIHFLERLNSSINETNSKSFRIGKEAYFKKFEHDIQSAYTADALYKKAIERKKELHTKMGELAEQLWPKYFSDTQKPSDSKKMIRLIIDTIASSHCHRDSFQLEIEKQIPELEKFINEKNLLYLDPSKPLVVRKTPEYMEGSGAGASINSPGPYDKGANTYYNVSPLDGYTNKAAESYLREYNNYTLQILNIHEAIPGHYTQLVYSNNAPSMIKSILGNGSMIEGWAVYGERMMLEEGYGNNNPELWMMYYKWHLRTVCNTILDFCVHTLNMTKEEGLDLLVNEAFQ